MPILCTLIAKQSSGLNTSPVLENSSSIIVEVNNDFPEGFPQTIKEYLLKATFEDERSIFNYKKQYLVNVLTKDKYIYACLTDEKYSNRRAHSFLTEVQEIFLSKPLNKEKEGLFGSLFGEKKLSSLLLEKMKYFTDNDVDPKISKIKKDAAETLDIMEQNLEFIIQRGKMIQELKDKTTTLKVETHGLKERAARLKKKAKFDYLKNGAMLVAGTVLSVIIL